MTYGDFAWNDLLRPQAAPSGRRRERAITPYIEGDPIPYLEIGEDDWVWKITRVIKRNLQRPRLQIILDVARPPRRAFGIDDYAQPILDEIVRQPNSVWVSMHESDRPGVKISDVGPAFPPKIERVESLPFTLRDGMHGTVQAAKKINPLLGSRPVGVYLSFGRVDIGNLGFGGAVRSVLDALSSPLGGDVDRPGKMRIRDLRVTRDPGLSDEVEVRLWTMD
jgi:hypothetical protein